MDGVLADFERNLLRLFRLRHPDKPYIPLEARKSFRAEEDYELLERGLKENKGHMWFKRVL